MSYLYDALFCVLLLVIFFQAIDKSPVLTLSVPLACFYFISNTIQFNAFEVHILIAAASSIVLATLCYWLFNGILAAMYLVIQFLWMINYGFMHAFYLVGGDFYGMRIEMAESVGVILIGLEIAVLTGMTYGGGRLRYRFS